MKKMLSLFLLALVVTGSHIAKSQSSNPDIYTYQNGDLWRYSLNASTAMPLTGSGYNGGPVLSPDGRSIAFLEAAPSFVADFNAGIASQTAGTPPADIWILDIAGQNLNKIADQSGASSAGYLRSIPTWSPHSRKLAWLHIDPLVQPLEVASPQVYSLDTGATVSLAGDVNLGYQESNITVPGLRWSAGASRVCSSPSCTGIKARSHSWKYLIRPPGREGNSTWNGRRTSPTWQVILCGRITLGKTSYCCGYKIIGKC